MRVSHLLAVVCLLWLVACQAQTTTPIATPTTAPLAQARPTLTQAPSLPTNTSQPVLQPTAPQTAPTVAVAQAATPTQAPTKVAQAPLSRDVYRPWSNGAAMPSQRSEVAAAEVGGKVYVVGGFGQGAGGGLTVEAIVDEYDPAKDQWRTVAPLPMGVHHPASASVGGKLYVMGGYDDGGRPLNRVFEYDPAVNRWQERSAMKTPRGALGAASINGKVYAVGGAPGRQGVAAEVYDPSADTWTSLPNLPTPRDHLAVVAAGGKLHVIGGRIDGNYGRNLAVHEVFDPASASWTTRRPMPTPRSGIGAAVLAGYIHVFGGEDPLRTFPEHEAYNPTKDSWETLTPLPTPRHGLGVVTVGEVILVIAGGRTPGGSVSNLVEIFKP